MHNKPNVAICMSGHLRSFRKTYKSFRKNVLIPTGAHIFIHTWDTINSTDSTWWSKDGDGKEYHQFTKDCLNEIIEYYGTKNIIVEKAKDFFKPEYYSINEKSACKLEHLYSMLYSTKKANELRKGYGAKNNINFDIVIRCRADLMFYSKLDLSSIKNDVLYSPNQSAHSEYGVVCDLLAYGSHKVMDIYFNFVDHFNEYFMSPKGILYCDQVIPEFALKSYLIDQNISVEIAPIHFGIMRMSGKMDIP